MITNISSRRLGLLVLLLVSASLSLAFLYTSIRRPDDMLTSFRTSAMSQTQEYISNTAAVADASPTRNEWDQCLDPGQEPSYYLSIVIVTRMDDYAGGQQHRLQNFIDSAYLLAENTKEQIELLVVEWNPPSDRRRVIDAFRFRRSDYLTYRIITVPKKIHDALPNVGNAPLHEFEGKNVGMRFARGEFIVCTNQDDIWSHNFHNAIQSHSFEKGVIYLQHQDAHNIHDPLPPSIVRLPPFASDKALYDSCQLGDQDWGKFVLPSPLNVSMDNILKIGDQAGDFTLAHRDTWKVPRGYREEGGVAWMDIEFICTAAWTFDIPVVYSEKGFTCHQDHQNIWEFNKEQHTDNKDIHMEDIRDKKKVYINQENKWALQQLDSWALGLQCMEFKGGLLVNQ